MPAATRSTASSSYNSPRTYFNDSAVKASTDRWRSFLDIAVVKLSKHINTGNFNKDFREILKVDNDQVSHQEFLGMETQSPMAPDKSG